VDIRRKSRSGTVPVRSGECRPEIQEGIGARSHRDIIEAIARAWHDDGISGIGHVIDCVIPASGVDHVVAAAYEYEVIASAGRDSVVAERRINELHAACCHNGVEAATDKHEMISGSDEIGVAVKQIGHRLVWANIKCAHVAFLVLWRHARIDPGKDC